MTALEKVTAMAQMTPIEIVKNNGGNNRQFPTLVNISETEMIEFYKGAGSGNAIVDDIDGVIRGFLYHNDDDSSILSSLCNTIEGIEELKDCSVRACEFSGTQILFPNK